MNCSHCECKVILDEAMAASGAYRWGVARAGEVDAAVADGFQEWLDGGNAASMDYLGRYSDIRRDPRLLLPGATSVVVAIFSYRTASHPDASLPRFARYALGDDYHEVLRKRLGDVACELKTRLGGEYRVCVDTAPMLERYWAVKAGVGFIGRNHQLIAGDAGSMFFVASILTTLDIPADQPCDGACSGCGRCVAACPGGALLPDGTFDARRCISYLTIEHRGGLPENVDLGGRVYGCDECQNVCPHNHTSTAASVAALPEFEPRQALMELTRDAIASMTQTQFSKIFSHSAVKRAKLAGLHRNNDNAK